MGILKPRPTPHLNQDRTVLDRCRDTCSECGASIPAGDVLCDDC